MKKRQAKTAKRAMATLSAGIALGLGGLGMAASPASATEPTSSSRVADITRYGTAAEISEATFAGGSDDVVLATGEVFADALAGNGLAGHLDAPILLTPSGSLHDHTEAELERLNADTVYVMGGTAAISQGVEDELEGMGLTVVRVEGTDRILTAVDAANEIGADNIGELGGDGTAILVNGFNFPDAVAASPAAFSQEIPVLLTHTGELSDPTGDALTALGIDRVLIVGGTAAVSDAVETEVEGMGITVDRYAGGDRYATAVDFARDFLMGELGWSGPEYDLATGQAFADALSGGPHAGTIQAPILLTSSASLATATQGFVQTTCDDFDQQIVLGGTAAVSGATADSAADAARCTDAAAPVAPASVTPTVNGTTITLSFPESTTATADSYNVYRVVRPPSGTCPDFNTAAGRPLFGAPVASVTDPTLGTVGGTALTNVNSGLQATTFYCFAVTAVDDGDESDTGAVATAQTGTPADVGAPTITDVRASDASTVGIVDAGDAHQFIFDEPMAQTIDDPGQLYRIQDGDGSVGEVVCGTNATCVLQGAGTFNGTAYPANRVLRVSITGAVAPLPGFSGTLPNVAYPATVTNTSAGWDDATGTDLDVSGSPDKVINVDTITPAFTADGTSPNIVSSVADESSGTVTLTYSEPVVCDNSAAAAAAFGYTDGDDADTAPSAVACNGTATVVLTFSGGVIQVADGAANINYTDENVAVDANDVRDLAGNQANFSDNNVPTVQP